MTWRRSIHLWTRLALTASVVMATASPLLWGAQRAAPRTEARVLVPDKPMSGELPGGQTDAYEIALEAGQFVALKIEQHTLVPLVIVNDPKGRQIVETRTRETSFVAELSGRHRIQVRADYPGAPAGSYRITVTAPRPASVTDRSRAAADKQLGEAGLLMTLATAEAIRSALDLLKSALALSRESAYRPGEIAALVSIGEAYLRLGGDARGARDHLSQALTLARESGDRLNEAAALCSLGASYTALPERRKAVDLCEQALAVQQTVGDARGEAVTLSLIGVALGDLREYQKALDYHERALARATEANDRVQLGIIHNNKAVIYLRTGDLHKVLDSLARARPLAQSTGRLRTQMMIANNSGIAYRELGDYPRALEAYEQAIALARKMGNALAEAQLLNNLGNLSREMGEHLKALDYYQRALPIHRQVQNRDGEAAALNNAGSTYAQMGEFRKALEYHEQSREIRRALGDRSRESTSLTQAAIALNRLGEVDKATSYLNDALRIRRQLGEPLAEAETLLQLGSIERDRYNLDEARTMVAAALQIIESMRARISDRSLRATYVARVQETYDLYVDVLMQQHAQAPSAGHDAAAMQLAERTRARVLLESLAEARTDIREGVDPALLERERVLQRQLDDASERLSRALTARSTDVDVARAQLDRLTAEFQQLETEIRTSSPRYAALTQPEPLTIEQIQRETLDEDTVLLEFGLGEKRSWLWAVTTQTVASFELPPRRDIESVARQWCAELTARPAGGAHTIAASRNGTAATLGRMLFGGIADKLRGSWRGKRLVIVATGALEYVPFAALPLPESGSDRTVTTLIAQHEIVEAPSASVLATLRREATERQPARHAVAVVADPVFDPEDPRVARLSRGSSGRSSGSRQPASVPPMAETSYLTSRAVELLAEKRGATVLARLPFSRDEARTITALARPNKTLSAIDFHASRATVLGAALGDYRIVHFATHGLIDTERPELSGLVLSLVNDRGVPQDGFLRLHDIFNMRLNANLVVLSACETAVGKEIKGEGLVSLTRGFMYAGAPRVVASLWRVNDLATAELMKRFYAAMLQRHLAPPAALRSAQLEMASVPRWASPYFWAGFVLQGDWR